MATHRRALTGLPTPKSPLDLWGQLMFLGVEDRMAPNWWAFRARYCIVEDTTIHRRNPNNGRVEAIKKKVVVGTRNLDQLQVRMAPFSFRALKADCLDLPPKIYEQATVHLSVAQQRAYHEMMKFATTELEAGLFASAKNAVGRITRLHQITCGFLVAEDGSVTELDNGRLVALTDTIDEMSGSLIIWCAYQQDVRRVTRHLHAIYPDRTVVQYYGPTPQSERAANVQAFQDGHADFFVGTAATGGFGITLTAAHNVIYYSCSFDLEHRLQSEDRCHRDGQTCAVTYVDLVANRTVDVKVLRALRDKKNVADAIMGDGVRAWLEL
jgi:SNF2 family DNA or RNA helicase